MDKTLWQLRDAKARFSQVVEAALQGEPQHVTRRGQAAVGVICEASFARCARGRLSVQLGYDGADVLIAATARTHGLTVITRDASHCKPGDVSVINPFAA